VTQAADGEVVLNPIPNGPLRIDGCFELITADGARHACGEKTWLCRCGHSGNKPFCDGTHKKIGFAA
jgi:CDGSH-type Zn-finger protein